MDEVGVWSRALTGNELTSVCNGALTVDEADIKQFSLYPNPASSNFTLQLFNENKLSDLTYVLSDITGKVISSNNVTSVKSQIAIDNLVKGIYLVSVFEQDQIIGTQRLVIE
jgi:hypothetical protein